MSEERSQFARQIDERTFSPSRRGYDKTEVRTYLQDLEQAFRELEGHSRRQAQKLADLERDVTAARATEKVSVDNAMLAVFDAKDRILERARRKAEEIEDDARMEAGRIRETAIREAGGGEGAAVGEIAAARAQADEIVASARREADRLRDEVGSAPDQDLEAELADMGTRLRRAHDETAAARAELDAARKRIVEIENQATDGGSEGLKDKFGELETLVSDSRADVARLTGELEAERAELEVARTAAAKAESALADLQVRSAQMEKDPAGARSNVAGVDATAELEELRSELEAERARLADLVDADRSRLDAEAKYEAVASELAASHSEIKRLQDAAATADDTGRRMAELEDARQDQEARLAATQVDRSEIAAKLDEADNDRRRLTDNLAEAQRDREALEAKLAEAIEQAQAVPEEPDANSVPVAEEVEATFAARLNGLESRLTDEQAHGEALSLLAEVGRLSGAAVAARTANGAAVGGPTSEADQILEYARAEAEEVIAEAEERADRRAAKVIAKAREEADQVRQTVATLTAQAEDARSAALRSKLEAQDLAEAQKAMSGARDDIVHTAESRAAEIEADAQRAAAAMRSEAEEILRNARREAEEVTSQEDVTSTHDVSETDHENEVIESIEQEVPSESTSPGAAGTDKATDSQDDNDGDELAALLAAAEQDLAAGEELRKQRERLDEQEAELAAQQAEAVLLASTRDTVSHVADATVSTEPIEEEAPLTATSGPTEPYSFDIAVEEPTPPPIAATEEEEDPAEHLSALLEEVSPSVPDIDAEPVDLDIPPTDPFSVDTAEMADTSESAAEAVETVEDVADTSESEIIEAFEDVAGADESASEVVELKGGPQEVAPSGPPDTAPTDPSRPRVAWPAPVSPPQPDASADGAADADQQSRYSSRSAQLPRLGGQAKSNMASMANLRKKGRGKG